MALVPKISMNLGVVEADFVHSFEVVSSWRQLTDTAVIQLPRKLRAKDRTLKELVKVGDSVKVLAGYDTAEELIFEGFATQVNPVLPFVVECEDPMFKLKKGSFTKSWRSVTLSELLDFIAPDFEKEFVDASLGKFQIENVTPAKVLEQLKKFGLWSFFRNGKLQVGLQYNPETAKEHVFDFSKNIHEDGNKLEFFTEESVSLRVKAISIGANNKKTVVEVGDEAGDVRTMNFFNLSEQELKAAAERELSRLKFDGYRGSFKTFGEPFVQHGDKVRVIDPVYPERAGSFWVDKVVRRGFLEGYSQEITLGAAI